MVVGAERLQPVFIAGRALTQPGAKDLLQAGKALEAEMLGEAHQRRRLHFGGSRDTRCRAEGDFIGIVERIGGNLAQPFRQLRLAFQNGGLQRLEILRHLCRRFRHGHVSLVSLDVSLAFGLTLID
ncbi:hypothetical protein D3C87_1796310 [compost metagenome]